MRFELDLNDLDLVQFRFRTATIMLIHVLFVITLVSLPYLNPCTVGNYLYPAPRMQQPAATQRSPPLVQPQPAQNDHHRPEDEMNDPNLEQLIDVGVAILSQALAHDLVSVVMRRLASLSGGAAHS